MATTSASGLLCIATVVILWVASSELIQLIFDSSLSFESPLFLTFYSTSLFSVYLFGFLVCPSWRAACWQESEVAREQGEDALEPLLSSSEVDLGETPHTLDQRVSIRKTGMLAIQVAPSWLLANWTFNAALCQSCGDAFSPLKLLCAAVNLSGVALLVRYDGTMKGTPNMAGDVLAVFSAACMALYSVQLKCTLPAPSDRNSQISMPMFFGFLGVTAALLCLPIFFAAVTLQWKGWGDLELIRQLMAHGRIIQALTVNGLLGTVLSDMIWARAVVLTSPLTTNLGVGFTIPLTFLVDHLRGGASASSAALQPMYLAGAAMVLVSFISANVLESQRHELHNRLAAPPVSAMYATSPPLSAYASPSLSFAPAASEPDNIMANTHARTDTLAPCREEVTEWTR